MHVAAQRGSGGMRSARNYHDKVERESVVQGMLNFGLSITHWSLQLQEVDKQKKELQACHDEAAAVSLAEPPSVLLSDVCDHWQGTWYSLKGLRYLISVLEYLTECSSALWNDW